MQSVLIQSYTWGVIIDWPASFDAYLDRLDSDAARGDAVAKLTRQILAAQLQELQELDSEPVEEDAVLKRVRQSRRYQVWRVAHPFHPLVAVRLIAWFPPERPESVVVALFAGDKKAIGDVWYDSVGARADAAIGQWKFQTQEEQR